MIAFWNMSAILPLIFREPRTDLAIAARTAVSFGYAWSGCGLKPGRDWCGGVPQPSIGTSLHRSYLNKGSNFVSHLHDFARNDEELVCASLEAKPAD
ncbi:MAG: hypothetical protein O2960_06910 [Verrucomicrobia bacterium]|nr:hypothetical protein [Verrucomicrobiota bacterium]